MNTGVYKTTKKNGDIYYRVSITFHNKHISLGSFDNPDTAALVYTEAASILNDKNTYYIDTDLYITSYNNCTSSISFEKFITLINYRDNGMYIKTPIYLCTNYFLYFLNNDTILIFNTDDLFYYSNHKIMTRGNYFFVNDYGIQTNILSRYGIKSHAVSGRDYIFRNGNTHDYRYENIMIINRFYGVTKTDKHGITSYRVKIHINGDYVIGVYPNEIQAAIAYNKAIDMLSPYININYTSNYIEGITSIEYASIYNKTRLSNNFIKFINTLHDN